MGWHEGTVVTAVNGIPITTSLASYCDAVDGIASGGQATFTVRGPGVSKARDVLVRME